MRIKASHSTGALRSSLIAREDSPAVLLSPGGCVRFHDLLSRRSVDGPDLEMRGRSVLIATRDQMAAALSLIALDGIARRLVLCPVDLHPSYLPFVMDAADVDAVVSEGSIDAPGHTAARSHAFESSQQTEWVLLTSGTTGLPKLVAHNLQSLAGAISEPAEPGDAVVWSTFYDIRRYGGLQIFLRAILTGTSLVLSDEYESTSEFLTRAGTHGVTHISGTPSHWRRALMSPAASALNPRYVRLSGEIADQGILDHLRSFYPQARVSHAFASTEAGVAFDVDDGQAGFPADLIGQSQPVELKVEDGSLRIRSSRVASRYLGPGAKPLADDDGFVDTGDMVSLQGDRYYFAGRRDGVINVGGLKVHPEEVEAVINHHPRVRMSMVHARKNPVMGALVVADVVLREASASTGIKDTELSNDLLLHCRNALPAYKVPVAINFVSSLGIAETGKLIRCHA